MPPIKYIFIYAHLNCKVTIPSKKKKKKTCEVTNMHLSQKKKKKKKKKNCEGAKMHFSQKKKKKKQENKHAFGQTMMDRVFCFYKIGLE